VHAVSGGLPAAGRAAHRQRPLPRGGARGGPVRRGHDQRDPARAAAGTVDGGGAGGRPSTSGITMRAAPGVYTARPMKPDRDSRAHSGGWTAGPARPVLPALLLALLAIVPFLPGVR